MAGTAWLLALFVAVSAVVWLLTRDAAVRPLAHGELMQMLKGDDPGLRFVSVQVVKNSHVTCELQTRDRFVANQADYELPPEARVVRTRLLDRDEDLLKRLEMRAGGAFSVVEDESLLRGLFSFLSFLLLIGTMALFGYLMMRWLAGGNTPFTFGRSRHKLYEEKDNKITFQDVAGIDEAVAELREIVDFLKTPHKYQALGGRIPKGVLLVGTPGTGKTLLAKAVAGEADVPFFSLSGSDFVEMFVGVGASRVRDLFEQAEARAPCIVFIDELDALGKTRAGNIVGSHDEREQTLNQLLVEMDGFDSDRGVIIMAATNRPETLDPALLRPGRFDRTVVVDRPDINGREAILKVHVRNVKIAKSVDLRHVASLTPGSVGADLANLVNEAALLAARNNKDEVTMAEFNEAIERSAMGLERKSRIMSAEEKRRTAVHEAGHALVACSLPNTDPVHKVTIIPRSIGAMGYMWQRPEDDRYNLTKSELESRIKVALGGTLAEEVYYGEIATGASSDLENANQMARHMVVAYGMSRLGRIFYRDEAETPFLPGASGFGGDRVSEATAREIDLEVRRIIDEAVAEVRELLQRRRPALEALANRLVEKEVIDGFEVREVIEAQSLGPKLATGTAPDV
ncbi:MAG: ATP-dependent zinc metalloprotease FtsH [Gemmataceae bacterium]|nr:ATP-dependent zinc metalloprotease FtsH [Gemmataceae bacterium]